MRRRRLALSVTEKGISPGRIFQKMVESDCLRILTRIPARWVQAIIPPLNSFYFKSARKSEFLVFLVFHDRKFVARLAREAVP